MNREAAQIQIDMEASRKKAESRKQYRKIAEGRNKHKTTKAKTAQTRNQNKTKHEIGRDVHVTTDAKQPKQERNTKSDDIFIWKKCYCT